jgi:hypothetical protein
MRRRWLLLLIPLGLGLVYFLWPGGPTSQLAKATLKDGTEISGQFVDKEYGKYIVIKSSDNVAHVITWDQLKIYNESSKPLYREVLRGLWGVLPQLAVAAGLFAFINGLWQYRDAQKWKRNEFLVKEITEYEKNQYVINAQAVLDSNGQTIDLPPKDASDTMPSMVVDSNTLTRALSILDPAKPLTTAETRIRESFDIFLSNLEKFNNFINSGLVRKKEIEIYLRYWLKIVGDKTSPKLTDTARTQLWNYIKDNDYPGVLELLKKFGYHVQ